MVSPMEKGSASAPGRSRTCRSRLRRSRPLIVKRQRISTEPAMSSRRRTAHGDHHQQHDQSRRAHGQMRVPGERIEEGAGDQAQQQRRRVHHAPQRRVGQVEPGRVAGHSHQVAPGRERLLHARDLLRGDPQQRGKARGGVGGEGKPRPVLAHLPVLQDQDVVGVGDRGQPVRHDDAGTARRAAGPAPYAPAAPWPGRGARMPRPGSPRRDRAGRCARRPAPAPARRRVRRRRVPAGCPARAAAPAANRPGPGCPARR